MTSPRSQIDSDRTVAALVRETPEFARVFESFDLDFCCGGDRSLESACADEGVDETAVRERLLEVRRQSDDNGPAWDSPTELVDHIIAHHHEPMRAELPAVERLVRKVTRVHGENHPELATVERAFSALADEMRTHTEEEENEVFPVIKKIFAGESVTSDEAATLRTMLDDLEEDHAETAAHLEQIAAATDDYAVPDDACTSYRNLLQRLESIERDTHLHVHKENNVLFPEVERELPA